MARDNLYIQHILDAINTVEEFLRGVDHDEFVADKLIQSAVIRQIEVIGEATKSLSVGLREQEKEIPWQDITGMRDMLIHEYFGVNYELIWDVIQKDFLSLDETIQEILRTH